MPFPAGFQQSEVILGRWRVRGKRCGAWLWFLGLGWVKNAVPSGQASHSEGFRRRFFGGLGLVGGLGGGFVCLAVAAAVPFGEFAPLLEAVAVGGQVVVQA
ncbi:hypothetical protein NM3230_2175 [Neisseria meningitidis NM3230]|nr:hypothetical protein NM3230_2175 [Neisseria meningitidis NM3230]